VAAIHTKTTRANKKDLRVRALLPNKVSLVCTEYEWVLETSYDVRDEAMTDVLKAIKSNLAAKKKRFHLKFKSKKDEHQSIVVLKKHWDHKRGDYSTNFGATKLRSPQSLPEEVECDSRLILPM
jgi:hypothetical protein